MMARLARVLEWIISRESHRSDAIATITTRPTMTISAELHEQRKRKGFVSARLTSQPIHDVYGNTRERISSEIRAANVTSSLGDR